VKSGSIVDSFPLKLPSDFGNQPELISSKPGAPLPLMPITSGEICGDDEYVVLLTDALAAWMLDEGGRDDRVKWLLECHSVDDFDALVVTEREKGHLKNDDATALIHHVRL
jgi:hypothetical protein